MQIFLWLWLALAAAAVRVATKVVEAAAAELRRTITFWTAIASKIKILLSGQAVPGRVHQSETGLRRVEETEGPAALLGL